MTTNSSPSEPRHPIRVVTERTGLSPDVLRAWERRYGAVNPARGEGRHRLYSDDDIRRLTLLVRAIQAGRSVASVVALPPEELGRLVAEDGEQGVEARTPAQAYLAQGMGAIHDLTPALLEATLRRAVLSLGIPEFLGKVLVPMIEKVGEVWHAGELGVAHEHAATAAMERLLGWLLRELAPGGGAPRLLMATPAGERHGLGALIAAVSAAVDGWHVTWLGADLPALEIAAAARRDLPDLVGLSIAIPKGSGALPRELADLRKALSIDTPLLLGGRGASAMPATEGIIMVRDLPHWHVLLRTHRPTHRWSS